MRRITLSLWLLLVISITIPCRGQEPKATPSGKPEDLLVWHPEITVSENVPGTKEMLLASQGVPMDLSIPSTDLEPTGDESTALGCCISLIRAGMAGNEQRWSDLSAPLSARDKSGKPNTGYKTESKFMITFHTFLFCTKGLDHYAPKIVAWYKWGALDVFEVRWKLNNPEVNLKEAILLFPIQQCRESLYRHASECWWDRFFEFLSRRAIIGPGIKKTPGEFSFMVSGLQTISISSLWGDSEGKYPVTLSFRGGPVTQGSAYADVARACDNLSKVTVKLRDAPSSLDSPEWRAFLDIVDERTKQQVFDSAKTADQTQLWSTFSLLMPPLEEQLETVYVIQDDNFYVAVQKTGEGASADRPYCYKCFFRQGEKLIGTNLWVNECFLGSLKDPRLVTLLKPVFEPSGTNTRKTNAGPAENQNK